VTVQQGETVSPAALKLPKQRKYRNQPVDMDGHHFDSKREAQRYCELKVLEQAGEIDGLVLQPSWEFKANGIKICKYVADFGYMPKGMAVMVVEDVKSKATAKNPVYRLKKRMMKAYWGIDVVEVY
jgi:hypothetical protein